MEIAYTFDSDECYKMENNPRGLFLLVNNRDFDSSTNMGRRDGTNVDADALELLFKELGFTVRRHNNATSYKMKMLCQEAAMTGHGSFDCFVCAILSHGDDGVVYGTDDTIEIKKLTKYFQQQGLAGKPKFFIFQACQGKYRI